MKPLDIVGNKYHLLKKIAVGGMAEIFLAEQTGPGGFKKRLVIKRILEHLVGDAKFLQMFQDEARLAAGLNHPNIVQIFELGQDHGTYYIAMEYVHGLNLRAIIQSCNEHNLWLAPEYIAKIGSQICEGLEYAHNFCDSEGNHMNIIHRDVSPQNIILSNQGVIKIVDFGIAKAASNKVETQAGVIKGKLAYMSPEQVKGQKLDRRSDIFSLGIVLYELATYTRPFQGKSDLDILRAILEAKPTPIEHHRPDFPQELGQIIYRALTKNRDERYASTRDLQWDLERFIQNHGKPIGPFQLQQLVTKLEELTSPASASSSGSGEAISPAAAQPTPHAVEADLDFEDDDLNEDTVYNPKGHANASSPYATGGHPGGSYEQSAQSNYSPGHQWVGSENQWDDEDEATVLSPSPVSASSYRGASEMPPQRMDTPPPGPPTFMEGQLPPGMSDYLNPLPPSQGGPPTMLDRPIPTAPQPPRTAPPVAQPRSHQPPVARPLNGGKGPTATKPNPFDPLPDSDIPSMMYSSSTITADPIPPPKSSRWLVGVIIGILLGGCAFAALYFLLFQS